jgi:hypothetical protein
MLVVHVARLSLRLRLVASECARSYGARPLVSRHPLPSALKTAIWSCTRAASDEATAASIATRDCSAVSKSRTRQELLVRHVEGRVHHVPSVAERFAIAQRRTVQGERLLGLFERGEHHGIERRARSGLPSLDAPERAARPYWGMTS